MLCHDARRGLVALLTGQLERALELSLSVLCEIAPIDFQIFTCPIQLNQTSG